MIAFNWLRVVHPIIALYAEGQLTTKKLTMIVVWHGRLLMMTGRVIIPMRCIVSPANPLQRGVYWLEVVSMQLHLFKGWHVKYIGPVAIVNKHPPAYIIRNNHLNGQCVVMRILDFLLVFLHEGDGLFLLLGHFGWPFQRKDLACLGPFDVEELESPADYCQDFEGA